MKTFFDDKGHPKIELLVKGKRQSGKLEAVLDTGFDGFLNLPITMAVALGLELTGLVPVEYADGRTNRELVFAVEVNLNGMTRTVPATLTAGSEALAGTSLFDEHEVKFDFTHKKITLAKAS
jgi:predicted aspartyl protease